MSDFLRMKSKTNGDLTLSYDLHVVRTSSWLDAEDDPILKADVDALVEADDELEWSTEDWVDLTEGRKQKPTRYFMILWRGHPCFLWCRNQITCSRPTEEQTGKLVEIAERLDAHVEGDDGECYTSDAWRATYRGE